MNYLEYGADFTSDQRDALDSVTKILKHKFSELGTQPFNRENPVVRLHEPTFRIEEVLVALETLLTTRVTMGHTVKAFEAEFSTYLGSNFPAVTCNSGSSANLLAVESLFSSSLQSPLRAGDEVIVPALSWSTTLWPLVQRGLVPVIVDIDPDTLNISIEQVQKAISPKTRAVMCVHVYGNPCDMARLTAICSEHRLYLIEDSCESMGARFGGKYVGTFGDLGTFSLYFSHHITSLEGGIVVSNNTELLECATIKRAHGWVRDLDDASHYTSRYPDIDPRFLFVDDGYNLRITELQGAIGLRQLERLSGFIERRREITKVFDGVNNTKIRRQRETEKGYSSAFGYALLCESKALRERAIYELSRRGIEWRPIICGNIARQPAMKKFKHRVVGSLEHSDFVMDCGISIGNHQNLSDDAIGYVAEILEDIQ